MIARVRAAEQRRRMPGDEPGRRRRLRARPWCSPTGRRSSAASAEQAYPLTRYARVTYSGSGLPGPATPKGQQADLGGTRLTPGPASPARPLS